MTMLDVTHDVVSPLGRLTAETLDENAGLENLNGRKVALVWDLLFSGDKMMEEIQAYLTSRYPGVEFIGHENFENIHGADERRVVKELPDRLRELGADAAIIGVGACGSCTPAVLRACVVSERVGIPAVGLISEGFGRQAVAVARAQGLAQPRVAHYPGVPTSDDEQTLRAKSREVISPLVEAQLIGAGIISDQHDAALPEEFAAGSPVFSGSLAEVQEHFHDKGWTDGLPVIPPTRELCEQMLEHTPLPADHVVGVLLPEGREVTVWSVAVNGVMAGCRPEYMPLLIAAVAAVADPFFRLEDAGATPGWEPQVIVSGPKVRELGLNDGQGALKMGNRANSTIGRFMKLCFINLAGLRIPPAGATDKGCIGAGFNVALAENDEATHAIGWKTMREEMGYGVDETVVAVQSMMGSTLPIYSGGHTPENHLQLIGEHIAGTTGHWSYLGVMFHEWWPLLVMSPAIAEVLAANGLSKDDVRRELAERSKVSARLWEEYPWQVGTDGFKLDEMVADGTAPAAYGESTDRDRMVPTLSYPDQVGIVLAGDPQRNQSRFLVNNHEHGPRVAVAAQFLD
ncbi:UGSC family (seleno)protein [Nocardioides sediminis]|uniref:UGSC family (seleno)protein n=1 Tax=Nocardioides sediminis TaxID=433648 RepID=UPI00131F1E95|nr:hypothetical protein [Nocardioides sediminis]